MTDKKEFEQVLIDAGIPTTDESVKSKWDEIVTEQGFVVENNSPFSPFWRLIKAIVTQPVLQVIEMLTTHIMPNTFVLTSKGEWLDKHGESRNTPRLGALKTQGNVQLTRADTTGELVIPAGTIIQSSAINNIVYQLTIIYDVTFNDGEGVKLALTEALKEGGDHNLTGGYFNKFYVPIDGVTVVNLDNWLVRAGQEVESDENYQLRIRDKFATLGNFHVDAVYRSIISEFPGILADNIVFDKNVPRGPGSATAYVHLTVGNISQAVVDEVNNHIASGYHGHGDDMLILAMPTQVHNITFDYWLHQNAEDIQNELEECVRAAFRENSAYKMTTCNANSTFSFSLLASELHQQFSQLKSLNFTNNDINTDLWLPVVGNLTATKQG